VSKMGEMARKSNGLSRVFSSLSVGCSQFHRGQQGVVDGG